MTKTQIITLFTDNQILKSDKVVLSTFTKEIEVYPKWSQLITNTFSLMPRLSFLVVYLIAINHCPIEIKEWKIPQDYSKKDLS